MSLYSFKRDVTLFIVYGGYKYELDISDITFSQTIQEDSYSDKTIQQQNYFERSKIYKANPANFSFTIPALREGDLKVVFNRLLDGYGFDLYAQTENDLFSISNCVITAGNFDTNRNVPLKLKLSGEGTQLIRVGDAQTAIPGTLVGRTATRTYNRIKDIEITIDTTGYLDHITDLSINLSNEVIWRNNLTINNCSSGQTVTYPADFYIVGKSLKGSFGSHLVEDFEPFKNVELTIKIGEIVESTHFGFIFYLDEVAILPSLETGEVFKYRYNWNYIGEPESIYEILKYITYQPGTEFSILDTSDNSILDYLNSPILEST